MCLIRRPVGELDNAIAQHQVVEREPGAAALPAPRAGGTTLQQVVDVIAPILPTDHAQPRRIDFQRVEHRGPAHQGLHFHVYIETPDVRLRRCPWDGP
nr:hypothetical protein [Paracidovorax cattleyae]